MTSSHSSYSQKRFVSHPAIFLTSIVLIVILIAAMVLIRLKSPADDGNTLDKYHVNACEGASESAACLKQLAKDRLSVSLKDASDTSEFVLMLSASEAQANELGYDLSGLQEKGFLISYQGNTLSLLSKSEAGMNRACYYLIYQCINSDGRLTLSQGEQIKDTGALAREEIRIGSTSIEDYTIVTDSSVDASFLCDLNYYICLASGAVLDSGDSGDGSPHISLSIDSNLASGDDSSADTDSFSISDGDIFLTGSKGSDLSQAICQFANTCLGWMYAGTSQEKLESGGILTLPVNTTDTSDAWMEEREAIITLWNTNYSRGIYYNNSTSLKTDIMSFSDEQLYDYVRMLKYCGFTGIQLTDMCSAWACAGSYEFVHERLRILADAAHSLDMNVTLWVWGAEFNGYGWTDDSVTYEILEGTTFVYENPDAVACFDKYYSIYAQLADCADRVIMHFYDPGNLSYTQDVAYFAKMFYDKISAINPDLNFGVSCYVDVFGKRYLVQTLGTDITLYEQGHHDNEADYVDFRGYIAESGVSLGTWAWNTCEMEIDQMASLYFTPHIIQSTYQTALQYDDIAKPEYWSEMDSNHVVNVFSLYCAGQLLIDPYRDVDELIHEIALAAVGEEYADAFSQVLYLIEDARSGESWDTYFWSSDHYILKSEDYDAEDILARSEAAIATLNEIIGMNLEANTLPLPISLTDLLTLMVPYIRQIQEFAQFRIVYGELESMQVDGAPAEDIQEKINSISTPISEYNTVIGSWGQIEARAQREMLSEFCSLYGYVTPTDPVYEMDRKYRIYSQFVTFQKGMDEPYRQYSWYFKWIFGYNESDLKRLIEEMEAEGILTRDPLTGEFYLTDWEHYTYAFN